MVKQENMVVAWLRNRNLFHHHLGAINYPVHKLKLLFLNIIFCRTQVGGYFMDSVWKQSRNAIDRDP